MKVFCATFIHETNPRSPIPTNLDSYREFYLYLPSTGEGANHLHGDMEGVNLARYLEQMGHDVVCGLAASAQPSMPTNRRDYEFLRDELLSNLKQALPVDAVMLFLHGAQIAEGYDDCEGDIQARIRAIVGPDIPIGVEFDLHGNVTAQMVDTADILMACKEYPHWDFEERCEQLLELMERTVKGEIQPVTFRQRVPMLGTYFTSQQPMRDLVDSLTELEGDQDVLSVSLCHGFPWGNIEDAGASILVVCNRNPVQAKVVAQEIAQKLFSLRKQIPPHVSNIAEAIDEAQSHKSYPVVIADIADNPGGGAAGDSTFLLEEILQRKMTGVAVAMIYDPMAVELAIKAGVGATLPLRLGGKSGPASGKPLDVTAHVIALNKDAAQMAQGMCVPFGPSAAIEVEGIQIVINTARNQTFTPECFTELGINPEEKKYLIVKSNQHFYEHFSSFASKVIYATSPGTINMDYANASLTNISRPVWPIDPTPLEAFGRTWGDTN